MRSGCHAQSDGPAAFAGLVERGVELVRRAGVDELRVTERRRTCPCQRNDAAVVDGVDRENYAGDC